MKNFNLKETTKEAKNNQKISIIAANTSTVKSLIVSLVKEAEKGYDSTYISSKILGSKEKKYQKKILSLLKQEGIKGYISTYDDLYIYWYNAKKGEGLKLRQLSTKVQATLNKRRKERIKSNLEDFIETSVVPWANQGINSISITEGDIQKIFSWEGEIDRDILKEFKTLLKEYKIKIIKNKYNYYMQW